MSAEAYFPITDEGVHAYFAATGEAVSKPAVLYTNPELTNVRQRLICLSSLPADRPQGETCHVRRKLPMWPSQIQAHR